MQPRYQVNEQHLIAADGEAINRLRRQHKASDTRSRGWETWLHRTAAKEDDRVLAR